MVLLSTCLQGRSKILGVLLGWDTYFASDMNSDTVYEMSYWYDDMIASEPAEYLMTPPKECVPS